MLGPPGAGKGTQAARLARELNLVHVATGDLFRQAVDERTAFGERARDFMEKGELIPDHLTVQLVLEKISTPECAGGVVFDGFPRNLRQAEELDAALLKMRKSIDRVVLIEVAEEELIKRLGGRWVCRRCQAPYHEEASPPQVAGKCDRCGGELYQRTDDNVETIKNRLKVYSSETVPLVNYYTRRGKLVIVAGEGGVDEVAASVLEAVT